MKKTWAVASGLITVVAVVLTGCGSDDEAVTTGTTIQQEILGEWYPWDISEYSPSTPDDPTFGKASITFEGDGTWSGSDGCNGLGGEYELSGDGVFKSSPPGVQTAIGCANVPNDRVLNDSTKAEIVHGMLVLSRELDNGNEITNGRYRRQPQMSPSPSPPRGEM